MLQLHHVFKSYGPTTVLADICAVINDGEHVALIGPNGAGKSTLLRCLTGDETSDRGTITRTPADLVLGYLPQALATTPAATVGDLVAAQQAAFTAAAAALDAATAALGESADDFAAAAARYDLALAHFEALGGYAREAATAAIFDGLGLAAVAPGTAVATLSGGQKTRLGLALLLIQQPDLLLLDEPTNHLDMAALAWLEEFVRGYRGAVLVVSHDRAFLDHTVTRTLYLDPTTHALRSYIGGYTAFAAARDHERALHSETWRRQQEHVAQVEADIARVKGRASAIQDGPKRGRDFYGTVSAKVAKLAVARERKLERYLKSEERVAKPRQSWGLKLDFGATPPSSRAVLRAEEVSFAYPGGPPLLTDVTFDVQYGERVALIGPNGAGKTTLLRLLAGELAAISGSIRLGPSVRLGLLSQEHAGLDLAQTVLDTVLRARPMSDTDARNFLHTFLFGGDSVFRPVGACSLGERARLQLAVLILSGCNLLLLDEPLNHLDIEGREHFEAALASFAGTVIAVAHDRAFLRTFAERTLTVQGGGIVLGGGYGG